MKDMVKEREVMEQVVSRGYVESKSRL